MIAPPRRQASDRGRVVRNRVAWATAWRPPELFSDLVSETISLNKFPVKRRRRREEYGSIAGVFRRSARDRLVPVCLVERQEGLSPPGRMAPAPADRAPPIPPAGPRGRVSPAPAAR